MREMPPEPGVGDDAQQWLDEGNAIRRGGLVAPSQQTEELILKIWLEDPDHRNKYVESLRNSYLGVEAEAVHLAMGTLYFQGGERSEHTNSPLFEACSGPFVGLVNRLEFALEDTDEAIVNPLNYVLSLGQMVVDDLESAELIEKFDSEPIDNLTPGGGYKLTDKGMGAYQAYLDRDFQLYIDSMREWRILTGREED